MKRLDFKLFDIIEEEATVSPRHRMNYDLRTQAEEPAIKDSGFMVQDSGWRDTSQWML